MEIKEHTIPANVVDNNILYMQTTTKIFSLCLVLCMWCLLLSSSLLAYIWKKMRTHKRKEKNECFPLMHIIQIHSKRMVEESFCTSTVANSQWAGSLFNANSISLVFFKRYIFNYPFRYQYGRMISFHPKKRMSEYQLVLTALSIILFVLYLHNIFFVDFITFTSEVVITFFVSSYSLTTLQCDK